MPPAPKIKKISIASVDEPILEELARFQNALDAIPRMRKEQLHATFSVDSLFNLMTAEEFLTPTLGRTTPLTRWKS